MPHTHVTGRIASVAACVLAAQALFLASPSAAVAQATPTTPPPAQQDTTQQDTTAAPVATTSTLVGVVMDSTTGRALVGATVQLSLLNDPSVGFATLSDSLGDYRVENVPGGRYAIGFFHPRLDSLGLEMPILGLIMPDSGIAQVDLGSPSPETIYSSVCGLGVDGLLLGTVRDADTGAPIANGAITAVWATIRIDERGLRNERRILNARSDSAGRFSICGLPTDAPARLQAATGASSAADESGEVELTFEPGRAAWRDLYVGRGDAVVMVAGPDSAAQAESGGRITRYRRGSAALVGQIRQQDGNPQSDAQVVVDGSGLAATTNASGTFQLDSLPAGTATVEVRALGYPPTHALVDLASGRTDTVSVMLPPRLPTLDPVTIFGQRTDDDATGFLRRSRSGRGRYITPEQINRQPAFDVTDYLRSVPGLRVVQSGGFGGEILIRDCSPAVFVDGMEVFQGSADLSNMVRPSDVAGIEVYNSATSTPFEFQRGGCGAVVVWTKGRLR